MKLLFDFLPIAIFFAVYHLSGDIIMATMVLIPATVAQLGIVWWRQRRIEKMLLITSIIVIASAGATIAFGAKLPEPSALARSLEVTFSAPEK